MSQQQEIVRLLKQAVKELEYAVRMARVRNEPSLPYLEHALNRAKYDLSQSQ